MGFTVPVAKLTVITYLSKDIGLFARLSNVVNKHTKQRSDNIVSMLPS